jgi:hypothetical protein
MKITIYDWSTRNPVIRTLVPMVPGSSSWDEPLMVGVKPVHREGT